MWITFLLNSTTLEPDCIKFNPGSASFCCMTLEKLVNPSVPLFLPIKCSC